METTTPTQTIEEEVFQVEETWDDPEVVEETAVEVEEVVEPEEEVPLPVVQKPPLKDLEALKAAIGRKNAPPESLAVPSEKKSFDHSLFQEDFSDGKIRTIDDICSKYPIGEGEFEVYVERKSPTIYRGSKIGGVQKAIKYRMDHETFSKTYGSGIYLLTVYGPTPGRRLNKEGLPSRKAFTKPIKVEIPDPYQQNPPVLEMAEVGVEEINMAVEFRRGGATDADAEIEKTRIEAELTKEERARFHEERKQAKLERREQALLQAEKTEKQHQQSFVEKLLEQQAEELRELRNKTPAEASMLGSLSQVLAAVRPEGPSTSEIHRLENELSKSREAHIGELSRLRAEHQSEINRLRDDSIRHERELRESKDKEMREREENLRNRIEDIQKERDRRIQELQEAHTSKLADERRQHDRDLAVAQSMSAQSNQTMGSTFEMRLEVKQQEINRLSQELATVRSELELEKSKTLADRVEEFAGAAEALGYQKEEGEKGWKEMLGEAAVGLIQNAPALAANVAASLRNQNQMPMLPAPGAGAHLPQQQSYRPVFATDGVDADLMDAATPAVIYPGQDPLSDYGPFEAEGEEEDEEEDEPIPARPSTPPKPRKVTALAQEPKPAQTPNTLNITDENIVEFSEMFRSAFTQGAPPEEFADGILAQLGPMMTGTLVREVPVKRVTTVLQSAVNGEQDPLVRRDGQKFLNKVWELVAQKTGSPVAG